MLKIGDFSRLAQVSIKTLRYYDEMGLLKPVEVDRFTGYRYYTLDQLPQINRISALRDVGFSVEQIGHLLNDGLKPDEIRGMLRLKRMELHQQVEEVQARLTRLEMRIRQIESEDKMPTYEIVVKHIESQSVLSIRQIAPTIADRTRLIDEVRTAVRQHRIKKSGALIVLYHNAEFRDIDLDVEVAVPIDASAPDTLLLSKGRQMTIRTLPAVETALTVVHRGSYYELGEAYIALNVHLQTHEQNYLGPAREVHLRSAEDTDNPAEYLTEIQYPVGAFTRDTVIDGIEFPAGWGDIEHTLPLSRRARTSLELATLESVALEQSEIRPAHLLIGMFREGKSLAGHVLSGFGMTIEPLRASLPRGASDTTEPPIADSVRQVIANAHSEAKQLGHDYIGTEHLLLALAHQRDNEVMRLFTQNGVNADQVRAAVMQELRT